MTLNKRLLAAVVNQIITYPETHNQDEYHCGTSHCVAGWAQVLGHGPMLKYPTNIWDDAVGLLGLSQDDAHYLFSSQRRISEIRIRASELITGDVYDRDEHGRDRHGYDLDEYDQYGRDRDGLDRNGRDRDGNSLPLLVVPSEGGEP